MVAIRRDIHDNVKVLKAFNSQTISSSTTTNGNVIDTKGYGAVEFVFSLGNWTDGTMTPLIEEGDAANLSDAAAVADANLFGTEAAAALGADNAISKIGYKVTTKRYVRFSVVSSGVSTGSAGVSADALLMNPQDAPVS